MKRICCLLGGEVVPNLLPILALRPSRVDCIASANDRSLESFPRLRSAARDLLPEEAFVLHALESKSPSPAEVQAVAAELLDRDGAIANLTGGTKLMSLGLFLAARERGAPSLYCDTAGRSFLAVGDPPLPPLPDFNQIADVVNVGMLLRAHGVDKSEWKSDQPTDSLRLFGASALALWRRRDQLLRKWTSDYLRPLLRPSERIVKNKNEIQPVLAEPLPGVGAEVEEYLELARTCGLVEHREGCWFLSVAGDKVETMSRRLEYISNLLEGGWWELAVLDRMVTSGEYTDVRWSVKPSGSERPFGETDIVAVRRADVCLVVVSCKSGGFSAEHVEALSSRARNKIGGSHAVPILAAFDPTPVSHHEGVIKGQKIELWNRDNLPGTATPAP